MIRDARVILSALHPTAPVYAMLDGARERRIRGWVLDTRAAAWCLWRGELPGAVADAAPWLLRLERDQEYTQRFFQVGWGNAWGILLASDAPSRELRRHLRRFLRVRTEQGKILLFRYYDPRVLRIYLPTLTAQDAARFFGPVLAFAAEEDGGGYRIFRSNRGQIEDRGFWTIREASMAAFERAARERFVGRMVQDLARNRPLAIAPDEFKAAVERGIGIAVSHGMERERDIEAFLHLWFESAFAIEQRWPFARSVLTNAALDGAAKVELLKRMRT